MKLVLLAVATFIVSAVPLHAQGFVDDFSSRKLDISEWTVSNGKAPQDGVFDPSNVDLSKGLLALRVTQSRGPDGIASSGGEIVSKRVFGYGTYEFTMRMGSTSATPDGPGRPVSGSVSAGFTYINNSQTEIDIEFIGNDPQHVHLTTWINPEPEKKPSVKQSSTISIPELAESFHSLGFVWHPGYIEWYVDSKLVAEHRVRIPTTPAHIILNHWGTNGDAWGGKAVLGTRYMYVKRVRFTPWAGR